MLSPDAKARITRAVEEAEEKAGVEVVVVGYVRADDYLDAAFRNALALALLVLALLLLLPFDVHPDVLLPAVIAAAGAGFFSCRVPAVLRATTSAARRALAVEGAVARSFLARGVHKTRERVGLLVVWFDVEETARVVFDTGLEKAIPHDVRERLSAALARAVLDGEQRAPAIAGLGEQLAPFVPRGEHKENELDNAPSAGAGAGAGAGAEA